MDRTRLQKLVALGADPPNDLEYLIKDLVSELRWRDVAEQHIQGVEIAIKIAFVLGEKNAALKMAADDNAR